ncbi:MAG: hypothetical protein ACI4F1_11110 [Bariatricus sp.]
MRLLSVVVESEHLSEEEKYRLPWKVDEIVRPYHLKWVFQNMYTVERGFDEDLAVSGARKALQEDEWLKGRIHISVWRSITTCRLDEINTEAMSEPEPGKIKKYREYFEQHGISEYTLTYPNLIVVDHDKNLLDGYISYLIMKEKGFTRAECLVADRDSRLKKFVYGIHWMGQNEKEYRWAYPLQDAVVPGDMLLVDTRFGEKLIKVTGVEMGTEAYVDSMKKVIKMINREKMDNGVYVL